MKARAAQGKIYEHDGLALTLKQWSKRAGIRYATLFARLFYYHMPFEEAISKPVRPWR